MAARQKPNVQALVIGQAICDLDLLCHGCHRPLDAKRRCWKCYDRLCPCGQRWTGSAFIELCQACAWQHQKVEEVKP